MSVVDALIIAAILLSLAGLLIAGRKTPAQIARDRMFKDLGKK